MPVPEILCVGEVLWDSLPDGLFLGGAPLNVACHLRALGVPAAIASRVGEDVLGAEVLRRLPRHGLATDLIQVDPVLPTGLARVTLDDDGSPGFEIVEPAAWDAIEATDALLGRAAGARAIVFGSLAQRAEVTRRTLERLCETGALKVFDVNLRPPYDDREIIRRSLERADLVKLSEQELAQLRAWFGLPGGLREATAALAGAFGCGTVCVTRGEAGAVLWREGRWSEHPGFRVQVRDTVGAGDAFLAALLAGLLDGKDDGAVLRQANLIGAYVASQPGAVPEYREEAIARIAAGERPEAGRAGRRGAQRPARKA